MNEKGNVLFLILIAVALFAALSYAVTQSTRGGGKDASKESAQTAAADFLQATMAGRQAIMRMRLSNGCADTDISFETPLLSYDMSHTPPVREACKLFSPQGGGIAFRESANWYDPAYYSPGYSYYVTGSMSVGKIGSAKNELLLFISGLRKDVCLAINEALGIAPVSGDAPPFTSLLNVSPVVEFKGVYGTPTNGADNINDAFSGRPNGCYKDPGNYYGYYDVLIER